MTWERINPYCLRCPPWSLAKHGGDPPRYLLTRDDEDRMEWFDSAADAKARAHERDAEQK